MYYIIMYEYIKSLSSVTILCRYLGTYAIVSFYNNDVSFEGTLVADGCIKGQTGPNSRK